MTAPCSAQRYFLRYSLYKLPLVDVELGWVADDYRHGRVRGQEGREVADANPAQVLLGHRHHSSK